MRIGIVLSARYPTEKAYGIQVDSMAQGFVDNGHTVAIAYPRRTSQAPTPVVGVEYIPCGPATRFAKLLFSVLRVVNLPFFISNIKKWNPDVLVVNDPLQAMVLATFFDVFWELHDMPHAVSRHRKYILRRWLLSRVKGVVSTNALKLVALKKQGLLSPLSPTIVLPNPSTFDIDGLRSISRKDARRHVGISESSGFIFGYIGQLFDWKGVDTVIDAIPLLKTRDILFCIVGGIGEDLERAKLRAANSGDGGRIIFHGQRPHEEVKYWLRAMDALVVPNSGRFAISREDTNPMKVYEAMAADAVLIVSDLPSIREAVEGYHKAIFVKPDDPMAWSYIMDEVSKKESDFSHSVKNNNIPGILTARDRAKKMIEFIKISSGPLNGAFSV